MTITVAQPASDYASSHVDLYINGHRLAVLGKDSEVHLKMEPGLHEVMAVCGMHKASFVCNRSERLKITWRLNPPAMVIERMK